MPIAAHFSGGRCFLAPSSWTIAGSSCVYGFSAVKPNPAWLKELVMVIALTCPKHLRRSKLHAVHTSCALPLGQYTTISEEGFCRNVTWTFGSDPNLKAAAVLWCSLAATSAEWTWHLAQFYVQSCYNKLSSFLSRTLHGHEKCTLSREACIFTTNVLSLLWKWLVSSMPCSLPDRKQAGSQCP